MSAPIREVRKFSFGDMRHLSRARDPKPAYRVGLARAHAEIERRRQDAAMWRAADDMALMLAPVGGSA